MNDVEFQISPVCRKSARLETAECRSGALATELKAGAELGSLAAGQRFGPDLKLQHFGERRVHPALIEEDS